MEIKIKKMGNKENTNSSNSRRSYFSKNKKTSSNGQATSGSNSNKPRLTRELKFHMHDSSQRKTSESYGKINESIVLKIQKTFTSSRLIAQSISTNVAQVFKSPELTASAKVDADNKALENRMLETKWKAD